MKRALKLLTVVLLISTICLIFSGCDVIDKMRKNQAFLIDSSTVEYDGEKYVLLPFCDYLQPQGSIDFDIYITEPDVPVLLSDMLGEIAYINDDCTIITCYGDYEDKYYCRADKYNETLEIINKGFESTGYCYSYYDHINSKTKYYCFTDEENFAIIDILNTVEQTVLPSEINVNYEYITDLEIYSHNLNFRKDSVSLCMSGDKYYILNDFNESTIIQNIPEEYNSIMNGIMKNLIESEKNWSGEYDYLPLD